MTQIGLDIELTLGGVRPADDHCADVCGPGAGYVLPSVVGRKFIGETSAKIVRLADIFRLADIYRMPPAIGGLIAKDVHPADLVKRDVSKCEVLKFVLGPAVPRPHETWGGVD